MKIDTIGNIAEIKTGKYDVNHSRDDGKYTFYTCAMGQFKSPTFSFDGDAIILPGNGANVGQVFFSEGEKFEAYQRTYVLQNFKANPRYIFFFFKAFWAKSLKNAQYGSATNYIRLNNITDLKIPLPSLNNQHQIANILNKAENLISQRKRSIALLDEFLKSTFLEMFYTNPETESWNEVKFEELAEKKKASMRSGPFGSSLLHGEFTETGDVKVLGIDNVVSNRFTWKRSRCITQEKYQELKRYRVYPNDVLISIMATLGRTAVVPEDIPICINSKHLAAITLEKKIANPFFVAYAFHTHPLIVKQMSNNVKGAIMDGLNLTIIRNIRLKVPPTQLQNRFGKIFGKVEALKAQYQSSLQELENLYGSLSQRAFRGELNLAEL